MADLTEAQEKCSLQSVLTAAKIAKYRSSQQKAGQCTAKSVTQITDHSDRFWAANRNRLCKFLFFYSFLICLQNRSRPQGKHYFYKCAAIALFMAVLDFLRRKKKDDILDLGATPPPAGPGAYGPAAFPGQGAGAGFPPMPGEQGQMPMDMGLPGMPPPTPGNYPQAPQMGSEQIENLRRTVETLNYKLDALKAAIDSINARLANIESAMKSSPTGERQEGWGTF